MIKKLFLPILFLTSPNLVWAKDAVSGKFSAEFIDNYTHDSSNFKNEFNENYIRSKLDLKLNFSKSWYLKSQFEIDRVNKESEKARRNGAAPYNDDASMENEGLYIKKLNLNFDYENASFSLGKFTAGFGQSFERQDNIWLFEEAKSGYRQDNKIGFSAYLKAGNAKENGEYLFSLSSFVNDNKYLDDALITRRDGSNKSDGTPGDKKGFSSYVAAMDIDYDFARDGKLSEEKLSYHFSYLNLGANENVSPVARDKIKDVSAYAANINYRYPISENLVGEGFAEYVNINNDDGDIDKDADFLTTSLSFYLFKNYSVTIGRYYSKQKEIGTNGVDNDVKELSFAYKFGEKSVLNNLQIMAGFKRKEMDYKTSKVVDNVAGIRAIYIKEF